MKTLLFAGLTMAFSFGAFAGELDNEVVNQELQGTAVVRIDTRTKEVAVLNTESVVSSQAEAVALTAQPFAVVPVKNVRTELDTDSGSSSWYVYWYGYSYAYTPVYAYYGNYWQPYYTYNYGYYRYCYYGRYNRWW